MTVRINALGEPPAGLPAAADITDKTATIVAETLRTIRSLPSPIADSAVLAGIYSKVQLTLTDSAALSVQLRANDASAADRAESKLEIDSNAANAASKAYGLIDCAT